MKVIGHVAKIEGRPTQAILWQLKFSLIELLCQIKHSDHPLEGYVTCLRSIAEQALVSNVSRTTPSPMGEHFVTPLADLTDTEQRTEENQWITLKDVEDTFFNAKISLVQISEHGIDDAYHSGDTAMGQRGFETTTLSQILTCLITIYGKPSINKLDQALIRLNEPMDRLQTVKVMLHGVEDVQLFLLSKPNEHWELPDALMISYVLIKLTNTGLYAKALEHWYGRPLTDRRQWNGFRPFLFKSVNVCYVKEVALPCNRRVMDWHSKPWAWTKRTENPLWRAF